MLFRSSSTSPWHFPFTPSTPEALPDGPAMCLPPFSCFVAPRTTPWLCPFPCGNPETAPSHSPTPVALLFATTMKPCELAPPGLGTSFEMCMLEFEPGEFVKPCLFSDASTVWATSWIAAATRLPFAQDGLHCDTVTFRVPVAQNRLHGDTATQTSFSSSQDGTGGDTGTSSRVPAVHDTSRCNAAAFRVPSVQNGSAGDATA